MRQTTSQPNSLRANYLFFDKNTFKVAKFSARVVGRNPKGQEVQCSWVKHADVGWSGYENGDRDGSGDADRDVDGYRLQCNFYIVILWYYTSVKKRV